MKRFLAALALAAFALPGCTHYLSLSPASEPNKVYMVKTTSYIIFADNSMYLCDISGNKVSNCQTITE